MATTPEQRDRHSLCGAKKKNGQPCRAYAGQGTDHFGYGTCKYHLGNAPNFKKHAAKLEAQHKMVTLGAPIDVTADQALKGILRATAGHVAWLAAEIAHLDEIGGDESGRMLALYGEERDRLARIAKACVDSGMTKREVELSQRQAETLAKAVDNAFRSIEGFTEQHRQRFGQALRMELAMLQEAAAEPAEVEADG